MNDTIVGISTALGNGAISIIRISGVNAITIANSIFSVDLTKKESHTITYGYIKFENNIIDEVLVTVMKSPKTYTTEDIVEINCRGGISTIEKILEIIVLKGARIAEHGEFTKRAFLNGRINIKQDEKVMNLIEYKTEKDRQVDINRLKGSVSNMIKELRQNMSEIIANIEMNIDYPEYEDEVVITNKIIKVKINEFKKEIQKILLESNSNKIIKNGVKTTIIGKPNVGKSSLLNRLIDEDKAIVTNIPGTTRDIVEGSIIIEGILFNITDTAGIRKTNNIIEDIGVNKSIKLIENSDLLLIVLDNNKKLSKEDKELLENTKNKNRIVIINKTDLNSKIEKDKLNEYIEISVKNNEGIDKLKNKIIEILQIKKLNSTDFTYIASDRENQMLNEALKIINDIEKGIENQMPIDMIEIDVKKIWNILGEITGESYSDELIDKLFSDFCLGK